MRGDAFSWRLGPDTWFLVCVPADGDREVLERDRAIRTARLHGLPRFDLRPIDVVVDHGSRRDLVLRRVSRLDALSGYPDRT